MPATETDGQMGPIPDPEIGAAVRANLDRDERLSNPKTVGAVVSNGAVTLTGAVPSEAEQLAAAQDAANAPGVVDVIDRIQVVPRVRRPDCAIGEDARSALESDPHLYAGGIIVGVVNGTIYLDGTVPTVYQIQQAADDVGEVVGVLNVVNRLTVAQ